MSAQTFRDMLPTMHSYVPVHEGAYTSEKNTTENEAFLAVEEQRPFPQEPPRRWRGFFYTATVVLTTVVLVFGAFRVWSTASTPSSIGRSPIPQFRSEVYIIHADDRYEAPADPDSNALWDAVLPGGKGFVLVEQPGEFGLPPGMPSPNNGTGTYGVTWTHEYHCLKLIREEFWNAIYGTSQFYGGYEADPPLSTYSARRLHHVQHCMNYVRQLIMCRADMTLEWAAPYPDALGNKNHIDGYGIPHQCTKWDDMYGYMEEAAPWPREHYKHHGH